MTDPQFQENQDPSRQDAAPAPPSRARPWMRWFKSLRPPAVEGVRRLRRYGRLVAAPETGWPQRARLLGLGGLVALGIFVHWLMVYAVLVFPLTPGTGSLKAAKVEHPSLVLSADGQEIVRYNRLNRKWVKLEEVAPVVVGALVATEDHRFYRHGGVDVRRLVSSAGRTLVEDAQGGSTLTMQLARNLYPTRIGRAVSLDRKMKEIVTALKIEAVYSKPEILETYLNTVPFLYNTHGIEMAARTYFDKSADRLDTLEAATLVGMLKGTAYYNPVRNPERAQARRNVVLGQMAKHGQLSAARLAGLKQEPVALDFEPQSVLKSRAPHFTAHLRDWLREWADAHEYDLYTDGLVIRTTLDLRMQEAAQDAVERQLEALQTIVDGEWSRGTIRRASTDPGGEPFAHFWQRHPEILEEAIRGSARFRSLRDAGLSADAALDTLRADEPYLDSLKLSQTRLETGFTAIDPRTGHVKAWVGSRDFYRDQYDHVGRAKRQPGSTFKPFVYAAALEDGHSPHDVYLDREVSIPLEGGGVWRPTNAGGASGRPYTLRAALSNSVNTITAQLVGEMGPVRVKAYAERMGVRESNLEAVPSLALGTSEVTLLEMVSAYATIAAQGVYHPPVLVTRIEDAQGNVLGTFTEQPERALDRDPAVALIDMLRGAVDEGTAVGIRNRFGIRADVAGKTGTTQDNADGWFILMHPELVGGAWVGFNDRRITFRSDYWGQGAHNALFVVGDFYRQAIREDLIRGSAQFPPAPYSYEAPRERGGTLFDRLGRWFGRKLGGEEERQPERRVQPPEQRREVRRSDERRLEQIREREIKRREVQNERARKVREQERRREERKREQRKKQEERGKGKEKERVGW